MVLVISDSEITGTVDVEFKSNPFGTYPEPYTITQAKAEAEAKAKAAQRARDIVK
jgi:hypothetical protein